MPPILAFIIETLINHVHDLNQFVAARVSWKPATRIWVKALKSTYCSCVKDEISSISKEVGPPWSLLVARDVSEAGFL